MGTLKRYTENRTVWTLAVARVEQLRKVAATKRIFSIFLDYSRETTSSQMQTPVVPGGKISQGPNPATCGSIPPA